MVRIILFALVVLVLVVTGKAALEGSSAAEALAETRCGWFENPTPANAWLTDAKGQWIIGTQGGSQADGDWPSFGKSQWIKTNGSYGYGCACMKVTTDADDMKVLSILSATAKPLSACRKDKALKGKEPR